MQNIYLCIGMGPGIGLSTAIRFAKEGFHPVLASRTPEKLEALAEEVRTATGRKVETVTLDAADPSNINELAKLYPNVSVLHYNAAIVHAESLAEMTYQSMYQDVQVGITGALASIKAFAPAMINQKKGSILLTGGVLAFKPIPQYLTLSIAKAGIRSMTEGLFSDLAAQGVHIGSVTVSKAIAPHSSEADDVAELFWKIHQQPEGQWTWEEIDA